MIRLTFTGHKEMAARLRRFSSRMPEAMLRAQVAEAEIELSEAKKRTPVDTGALRASGFVRAMRSGSRGVVIGFGGPTVSYALIVHEDLEAYHRVGQAKYLESVLVESAPFMAARLARRLAQELPDAAR